MTRGSISFFKEEYPHIPIEKYKAKANEMKPTNGTSYKSKDRPKFKIWDKEKNEWYKPTYEAYNGEVEVLSLSPGGDLTMRTLSESAHESTFPDRFEVVMEVPKVVVPKFVADWIELCKEKANLIDCLQGGYRHFNGCEHIGEDKDWLFEGDNQDVVARAWLDGYEVEKEPLYHVKFPNITNCGFSIFLFKDGNGEIEIADNADYERMRFTEAEIKAIDERYWPFAVKVSDE